MATDGGIFAFGDAGFYGSMGGQHLNQPVVGMAEDPATHGYWLVATDGGIFAFGAPFYGSMGAVRLNRPINGMAVTADGRGYGFVASDGGMFTFGDFAFHGSAGALSPGGAGHRAWLPTSPTAATGWSGRTAGSSPTAPRTTAPADRTGQPVRGRPPR